MDRISQPRVALEDVEAGLIERAMLELSRVLATAPIEALDDAALRAELSRTLARSG